MEKTPIEHSIPISAIKKEALAHPDSIPVQLKLATALLHCGMLHEGEQTLKRVLSLDENCAGAWVNLGGVAMSRMDFMGCAQANRRALASEPNMALAHFNLGLACLYLNQADEVVRCFQRVLELEPENGAAYYYYAVGLLALDELEAAQKSLAIAMELGHGPQAEFIRELERKLGEKSMTIEVGQGPAEPDADLEKDAMDSDT